MRKIEELNGVNSIDSDDLSNAVEQLLYAAQMLIELEGSLMDTQAKLTTEQEIKAQLQVLQSNPQMVVGMAMLATIERFRVDYAYQQNTTNMLLQDIIESIDCAAANAPADGLNLMALSGEQVVAALRERWLNLNPKHDKNRYLAAISEFKKLVGL